MRCLVQSAARDRLRQAHVLYPGQCASMIKSATINTAQRPKHCHRRNTNTHNTRGRFDVFPACARRNCVRKARQSVLAWITMSEHVAWRHNVIVYTLAREHQTLSQGGTYYCLIYISLGTLKVTSYYRPIVLQESTEWLSHFLRCKAWGKITDVR